MEDFFELIFLGIYNLFRGMFGKFGFGAAVGCWIGFGILCGIGYVIVKLAMADADERKQFQFNCEQDGYTVIIDKDNKQQCVKTIDING